MAVTYDEAVSFTDSLFALRRLKPFSFDAGPNTRIRVSPCRRLLNARTERLRYCEDMPLSTIRMDLEVEEFGGKWSTCMYLSAGNWYGSPHAQFENGRSHYLILHDRRRLCAQQINLRTYLVRQGGTLRLFATPRFPKGGKVLTERLLNWMREYVRLRVRKKRLALGTGEDPRQILISLLLLGLAKQHLRRIQMVPAWGGQLVPMDTEDDDEAFTLDDELDEDLEDGEPPEGWTGLWQQEPPSANPSTRGSSTPGGRKVDFQEAGARAQQIGRLGELLVEDQQRNYLKEHGRSDLAEKVLHVAKVNDMAGYDIQSYTLGGEPVYIEVKTTVGDIQRPFMLSAGELECSQQHPENFRLYRLFQFEEELKRARFYVLEGNLNEHLDLHPTEFRARIK